jgi:hypothetical protein
MKCWVPCTRCSYEEVARVVCDTLTKSPSEADYCIDDVVMFAERFHFVTPKCTLWGDTMSHPAYHLRYRDTLSFLSASKWVHDYFSRFGFHVLGYRPFPVTHVEVDAKKDVDFLTVGVSRFFDRKNLSTLVDLGIRGRTIVVGEPNPSLGVRGGKLTNVSVVTPDYHAFSLSLQELHTLYSRSRFYFAPSLSEGVGLPPVEAMFHGVIPVYVDGHGFHDNLTGLPVDVVDEYTLEVDGYYFRIWEPSLHDLKYEVDHALTMPREEYEDLKAKVQEKARDYEQKAFLEK